MRAAAWEFLFILHGQEMCRSETKSKTERRYLVTVVLLKYSTRLRNSTSLFSSVLKEQCYLDVWSQSDLELGLRI